jgi:hypothetical protein
MPFDEGSNKEGEDLTTPLPYKTKDDLQTSNAKIVLYGTHASPATCKTRALLNLAGVDYERRFGKHPTSDYRKFPVVIIEHTTTDGTEATTTTHQINDSHIIFKNLAPILFEGYILTQDDVDLEREATFGLMLACEKEAFGDVDSMKQWAATAGIVGMSGVLVRNLAPLSLAKRGAEKIATNHPALKTPLEYCTAIFQAALLKRGTKFFHGDDVPGPLDASIYGSMAVWAPGGDNTMLFMREALEESGLAQWYDEVSKAIPHMWKRHGWFPLYT